jgi:hypothetical protein
VLLASALPACSSPPAKPACTPTYVYSGVKTHGSALNVVDLETEYNGSATAETFTLNDTHGSSVAIEDSTETASPADAMFSDSAPITEDDPEFAPVTAAQSAAIYNSVSQTDSSVRTEASQTTGSQVQITVPAGATAYGLFGVVMDVTSGDLHAKSCPSLAQASQETVIIPEEYEWCTWTRGPDEFTDGGLSPCVVVAYDLKH